MTASRVRVGLAGKWIRVQNTTGTRGILVTLVSTPITRQSAEPEFYQQPWMRPPGGSARLGHPQNLLPRVLPDQVRVIGLDVLLDVRDELVVGLAFDVRAAGAVDYRHDASLGSLVPQA